MKLEALVLDKPGTYDAFAAGAILITVLGRCRWSDLTAGLQGMKGRLLPILIPIFSFGIVPIVQKFEANCNCFWTRLEEQTAGSFVANFD